MNHATIFIDTNALPRGLNKLSTEMERLAELAEFDLVRVHISWVSVNEWRTQMVQEYLKKITALTSSIDDVLKLPVSAGLPQHGKLIEIQQNKMEMHDEAKLLMQQLVDGVFERLRMTIEEIDSTDGKEVMRRYFDGHSPFSGPKSRKDIPDAFIYRAVQRLARGVGKGVYVVCNDEGLGTALKKLGNVIVSKDLKALLSTDALVNASTQLPIAKFWSKPARDEIVASMRHHTEFLNEQIEEWAEAELPGGTVYDGSIPEDNNEATIVNVSDVVDIEIDWDEAESQGPGWLQVPFQFSCLLELEFLIYRGDAFHADDWIHVSFPDDFESDHYYEASGERYAQVTGSLIFQFSMEQIQADEMDVPRPQIEDTDVLLRDEEGEDYL